MFGLKHRNESPKIISEQQFPQSDAVRREIPPIPESVGEIGKKAQGPINKFKRRNLFLGLAAAAALITKSFDGPSRKWDEAKELSDMRDKNLRFSEMLNQFEKLVSEYRNKSNKTPKEFKVVLEDYFKLLNFFGQTREFNNSIFIDSDQSELVLKKIETMKNIENNLKQADIALAQELVLLKPGPNDNKENEQFNILTNKDLEDPFIKFYSLYNSVNPATLNIYRYRDLLVKMSTVIGVMEAKCSQAEKQKSSQAPKLNQKYQNAKSKYITYKVAFLNQL
jgi:hypothetical protein